MLSWPCFSRCRLFVASRLAPHPHFSAGMIEMAHSPTQKVMYQIGVDIGGTFTDIVLLGDDGDLCTRKVLSTPDDYGRGIVEGIQGLLADRDIGAQNVRRVVHAT